MANCTSFVKDFGLMPMLVSELGLEPPARELFLLKVSMCYACVVDKAQRDAEREAG